MDLSHGLGAALKAALQDEPISPLIPLGSTGQLQGANWQVVGFQHRIGHEPGDSDEHFGWQEYLLYNAKRGFVFLVDAEDGWSLVKPVTGRANAKELSFELLDSGYKVATAGSAEVGRSETIQYFHGSECAFWPNAPSKNCLRINKKPTLAIKTALN